MRGLIGTFVMFLLCSVMGARAAPNIVVILTDDQEDTGSTAYMPLLHSLAEQGVTFTNSFVNFSLCAPSRSSFLTGEAAHNDGIKSNRATKGGGWSTFRSDEANDLAVWLQTAGYQTALIGKYLNGYGTGKSPNKSGFGHWAAAVGGWFGLSTNPDPRAVMPPGWNLWYAFTNVGYYDYSISENGKLVHFGHEATDYSTDVLRDRAVRFINDQAGSTAPFFMLIAPKAPHGLGNEGAIGPAIPSPTYAEAFADIKLPTSPAFNEADVSDKPPKVAEMPILDGAAKNRIEAIYRAELQSLRSVDDLIGAVVEELRTAGKLDNTMIIYTSDNGFEFGDHRLLGKISVYEGSIRVPLVMKGPGIPRNEARGQLVNNLDVVATIEQVAGLKPGLTPDGRSLMPIFSDANVPWRSAILVEGGNDVAKADRRYAAVRTATRKYVRYEDGFEELYDLVADPYELENKAKDLGYANDVSALRGLHNQLKSCAGDGCWTP